MMFLWSMMSEGKSARMKNTLIFWFQSESEKMSHRVSDSDQENTLWWSTLMKINRFVEIGRFNGSSRYRSCSACGSVFMLKLKAAEEQHTVHRGVEHFCFRTRAESWTLLQWTSMHECTPAGLNKHILEPHSSAAALRPCREVNVSAQGGRWGGSHEGFRDGLMFPQNPTILSQNNNCRERRTHL